MLKDVTSSAAALYDGGWRAEDRDRLIAEYDLTEDEADILCAELEDMEPEIRTLRVQAGMTQREFSEYLNIPLRTIQEWEQGRRTPPDYVVELIRYKVEKERISLLRLVELNEGKRQVLAEGYLQDIVQYLQDNEDLYNWVNDEIDPNTGPIELPDLSDIETLRDLEYELSKTDLGWWALEVKEV